MVSIFLLLGFAFLLTFLIGILLEKIRIPWIFAALLLGIFLAIKNPFASITSSSTFGFLAQLGMYSLLFIIGFELNLKKLKKRKNFIIKSTFFIIFFEAIFGTLLIRYIFDYSWIISSLVALSFATVGEAILLPILDEFKIVNTKLGQTIIGIGTLDDTIEIFTLVVVAVLIGSKIQGIENVLLAIGGLFVLIALSILLIKLKDKIRFKKISQELSFIIAISIFFTFLGIGKIADLASISALFAGITIKNFFPKNKLNEIGFKIKTLGYGLFAPIFFLEVGITMDVKYVLYSPLLILLFILVSAGSKILSSWLAGKRELGTKKSILLGIGLSVRFSTSIIIIKILLEHNLIRSDLYSIIIASTVIFSFIIPILFSYLLIKWRIIKNARTLK